MVLAYRADDNVMAKQSWTPIDGNTPISFGVGVIAGMSNLNASWAMVVVISFEALMIALDELSVSAPFIHSAATRSAGNQAVDTMAGIFGVAVGESIRKKRLLQQQVTDQQTEQKTQIREQSGTSTFTMNPMAGPQFINTEFPLVRVKGVRRVRSR